MIQDTCCCGSGFATSSKSDCENRFRHEAWLRAHEVCRSSAQPMKDRSAVQLISAINWLVMTKEDFERLSEIFKASAKQKGGADEQGK